MSKLKTIFDNDGVSTTYFEEEHDGSFSLTKVMDASPVLEKNKREYNEGVNNSTHSAIGRKVASIPLTVWQNWIKETNGDIQKDPAVLARYLNDPDNKYFRTHKSNI